MKVVDVRGSQDGIIACECTNNTSFSVPLGSPWDQPEFSFSACRIRQPRCYITCLCRTLQGGLDRAAGGCVFLCSVVYWYQVGIATPPRGGWGSLYRHTRRTRATHRFCGSCPFADLHIIHVGFRQSVRTNALSVCMCTPPLLLYPHILEGQTIHPVRFAAFSLVSANVHFHSGRTADVTKIFVAEQDMPS